jgi:hypothetical protein
VHKVPRGILHGSQPDALQELSGGKIEVTSVFRRLARELVIFVFIIGFIGACIGTGHEFEQTKPSPMPVTITPDVPEGVTVFPNGYRVEPPPCTAAKDEWQTVKQNAIPCMETPEQIAGRLAREKERYEAGEKAKRESRLVDVSAFGVFGFGIGGLAGALLWGFYRGARFAIYG